MTTKMKIVVNGVIDQRWNEYFDGLEISNAGKNTIFTGKILDQSHLHGILNIIRDLNLKLISINPVKK